MKYSIGNSIAVSCILFKDCEQAGWLTCCAPALRSCLANAKSAEEPSADFGCPNTISQIWQQGLPSMGLSWLHNFWPAHWRRHTVLCLIQNILWKRSKCLMGRVWTPLARKTDFPDSFLSPPPPLLEEFSTRYHLWTRGSKTLREHSRGVKSQTCVITYRSSFSAQITNWADVSLSWALCVGPAPSLGCPVTPGKTQLEVCKCELCGGAAEAAKWAGPFLWAPPIQQHPPLPARGREKPARVIPSDKMIKPSQQRSF